MFTGDSTIYKMIAFICCGKSVLALPTMLQYYWENLTTLNQYCSTG